MGELTPGMAVSTRATGQRLVVMAAKREHHAAGVSVYNCEVGGEHTYFVGRAAGGA